jgi:hypothetical protein
MITTFDKWIAIFSLMSLIGFYSSPGAGPARNLNPRPILQKAGAITTYTSFAATPDESSNAVSLGL